MNLLRVGEGGQKGAEIVGIGSLAHQFSPPHYQRTHLLGGLGERERPREGRIQTCHRDPRVGGLADHGVEIRQGSGPVRAIKADQSSRECRQRAHSKISV